MTLKMNKYVQLPFIMTVSGSNGEGKSHYIKYLISSFYKVWDLVVVFSNTAEFNNSYDFLSEKQNKFFIFNTIYYEEALKKIMAIQRNNIKNGNNRKILIVFDDVLGQCKDSKILKILISQNRHFNMSVIFAVQYINLAATYLREISYYDVLFSLKTHNSLKACYDNYFISDYDNFTEFKKNMKLERYQFFFADRLTNTKRILRCPAT